MGEVIDTQVSLEERKQIAAAQLAALGVKDASELPKDKFAEAFKAGRMSFAACEPDEIDYLLTADTLEEKTTFIGSLPTDPGNQDQQTIEEE